MEKTEHERTIALEQQMTQVTAWLSSPSEAIEAIGQLKIDDAQTDGVKNWDSIKAIRIMSKHKVVNRDPLQSLQKKTIVKLRSSTKMDQSRRILL